MRPAGAVKDRYGFLFWLRWIFLFAGSFIASAAAWTLGLQAYFGRLRGPELTLTWTVAVFGGWFLLVIPFMRKKERIWKRLNDDQEKAVDAWFFGMALFIGLLIASCVFWSAWLEDGIATPGMNPVWGKAVFASWLAVLVPFLVYMYRKADKIFAAAKDRQAGARSYRASYADPARRRLPETVAQKLRKTKPTMPGGYLVALRLADGRQVPYAFVAEGHDLVGLYDRAEFDFDAADVVSAEPVTRFPSFDESLWHRLDVQKPV